MFTDPLVLTSGNGSNSTEEYRDKECNGDGCDLHDENEIFILDYLCDDAVVHKVEK